MGRPIRRRRQQGRRAQADDRGREAPRGRRSAAPAASRPAAPSTRRSRSSAASRTTPSSRSGRTRSGTSASGLGAEVSLKDFRKDIIIELYNEAGQLAIAYKVFRCWVSEFQALPDLDANANAVAIQHIKLENEGWERDYDGDRARPSRLFTEPGGLAGSRRLRWRTWRWAVVPCPTMRPCSTSGSDRARSSDPGASSLRRAAGARAGRGGSAARWAAATARLRAASVGALLRALDPGETAVRACAERLELELHRRGTRAPGAESVMTGTRADGRRPAISAALTAPTSLRPRRRRRDPAARDPRTLHRIRHAAIDVARASRGGHALAWPTLDPAAGTVARGAVRCLRTAVAGTARRAGAVVGRAGVPRPHDCSTRCTCWRRPTAGPRTSSLDLSDERRAVYLATGHGMTGLLRRLAERTLDRECASRTFTPADALAPGAGRPRSGRAGYSGESEPTVPPSRSASRFRSEAEALGPPIPEPSRVPPEPWSQRRSIRIRDLSLRRPPAPGRRAPGRHPLRLWIGRRQRQHVALEPVEQRPGAGSRSPPRRKSIRHSIRQVRTHHPAHCCEPSRQGVISFPTGSRRSRRSLGLSSTTTPRSGFHDARPVAHLPAGRANPRPRCTCISGGSR